MNEDFIKLKQPVIEKACKTICKHSELSKDLAQEVSIYFLTNELPLNKTKIDGFIFVVAYKMYHLSGSEFNRLHFDNVLNESLDIDHLKKEDIPCVNDNRYAEYKEHIGQLDSMEQIWVEEIVKRNLSIALFSEHTSIHRTTVTERMDLIYSKIRNNSK